MRIDLDALRDVATVLRNADQDASDLTTGLQEAIASAGACWGTDEAGQQFAASYQQQAAGVQASIAQVPSACAGLAAAPEVLADGTQNLDGTNASQVRQSGS
jgi:uncharacterized protein YukE